ncbi:MAG: hypothetical protein ACI9JD_000921 [Rhodococcus sp. (in: high G+C Gram-positive bacteria)]|jgi:hypothetical protein
MSDWATPEDLRNRLRKRWDRGLYLSALARGDQFEAVDVKIAGPKVAELNSRRAGVSDWVQQWHRQAQTAGTEVVYRTVGGRGLVGQNRLPDRLRISTLADLEHFLGSATQTRRYREILTRTVDHPSVHDWVSQRPMRSLEHYDHLEPLLAALAWIDANAGSGRRLREIDAAGVDTKFIERHQRVLLELGRLVVDEDLIDLNAPTIAGRFGFATPGRRVRLRRLDDAMAWPMPGFDDIEVRAEDLATLPLALDRVFVIENLATYLSFPAAELAVAIFGGGYAASSLGAIGWLRGVDVVYWGDLDTHGFAILDRLRVALPQARSILMDRDTLLGHHRQWGTEPTQVDRDLPNLTPEEERCYRELIDGAHGPSIRLEQERIPLSALTGIIASNNSCPNMSAETPGAQSVSNAGEILHDLSS